MTLSITKGGLNDTSSASSGSSCSEDDDKDNNKKKSKLTIKRPVIRKKKTTTTSPTKSSKSDSKPKPSKKPSIQQHATKKRPRGRNQSDSDGGGRFGRTSTTTTTTCDFNLDSSSSDDDDDSFLLYETKASSFFATTKKSTPSQSMSQPQTKQILPKDSDDDDSDDTAELLRHMKKKKKNNNMSIEEPTTKSLLGRDSSSFEVPLPSSADTSRRKLGGDALLDNNSNSSPRHNNKFSFEDTDVDDYYDDDDEDDINSVDTAELLKRIPTKPGVQVSQPYISSATKNTTPPSRSPLPQEQASHTRQSDEIETTSPPKSLDAEAFSKSSPVRFELPAQFDSSSSSGSEDEEDDDGYDNGFGKHENLEENRQIHADRQKQHKGVGATRLPFTEANGAVQKYNPPSPQIQQRHLETTRTVVAQTVQMGQANGTNFDCDMSNHHNNEQLHYPDRHIQQSNDDLFRNAFMGGYKDDSVEQHHHTERNHHGRNDDNEQGMQQHDSVPTEAELFHDAFLDGASSLPTTTADRYQESMMGQFRDQRTEAELFARPSFYNSNDRKQPPEIIDLADDSDDEDVNAYQNGTGRYPSTSPAYNLKARNFLRRGIAGGYPNLADGFSDANDHDRLENQPPRRVTEDHSHRLRQTSTEAEAYHRNGKPFAGVPRPWNSNGANRRIRDPAASNVALAASVAVGRRPVNTRQVATQVLYAHVAPAAATRSGQSETYEKRDIRNFLQAPRFTAETRQRVRERINASRHDIEGHSDVAMIDRFPTRSQAKNNEDEEVDDIIELVEPVHARRSRTSRTPKASAAKPKPKRKTGGGRKRSSGTSRRGGGGGGGGRGGRGQGRGRGRGRYTRNNGNASNGSRSGSADGAWGGEGGNWAAAPVVRPEDPQFQNIGAEISF
jgi:uncharacterized membrane protein YgcG